MGDRMECKAGYHPPMVYIQLAGRASLPETNVHNQCLLSKLQPLADFLLMELQFLFRGNSRGVWLGREKDHG
ncbi:hypothetical protein TH61_02125 [Rufibacter sp. DG15C]|nr:hypothetical protein TH61_02125 [Rufibacter sp. DG15C]